jgi:hypothetical protein
LELKLYTAFGTLDWYQQTSSTVLNIVTTYAWTGSAYVVPSATARGLQWPEVLL